MTQIEKKKLSAEEVARLVKLLDGKKLDVDYAEISWGLFVVARMTAVTDLVVAELREHIKQTAPALLVGRSRATKKDLLGAYATWLTTDFRQALEEDPVLETEGGGKIVIRSIHGAPSPNLDGVTSGRFQSAEPNLQRPAPRTEEGRALAEAFEPEPALLEMDYSPAEARMAAHMMNQERASSPPVFLDAHIEVGMAASLDPLVSEAIVGVQRREDDAPVEMVEVKKRTPSKLGVASLLAIAATQGMEDFLAPFENAEALPPMPKVRGRKDEVVELLEQFPAEYRRQLVQLKELLKSAPNRAARRRAESLARKIDRPLRRIDVTLDEVLAVV